MTTKHVYVVLALIGLVVPYCFFVTFLLAYGLDGSAFLRQLFGTPIATFFAVDLLISCVVFVLFLRQESMALRDGILVGLSRRAGDSWTLLRVAALPVRAPSTHRGGISKCWRLGQVSRLTLGYSSRSTTAGSTRVARKAGRAHAVAATRVSSITTAERTAGSSGSTS